MKLKSIILILLFTVLFSSCEYHFGGAKVFKATSDSLSFKDSINYYNIKYISPNVYGVMFSDLYRAEGFFAYNVKENGNDIAYNRLDDNYVNKLKLKPDFNWWEAYGKWIAILLFAIYIFMSIFGNSD